MTATTIATRAPSSRRARSRPLVAVLTAGTFVMGTTEFVVAGVLPQVARDLGVGVADASLTITIFAIGMIIGTPVMAMATLRLKRRSALAAALIVFAIGHAVVVIADDLTVILVARFMTALATGGFWAVAAVVATNAVAERERARVLGIVLGGGMLATVIGVPLGTIAGQLAGWRSPFTALTVVGLFLAVMISRTVPLEGPLSDASSVRHELASLRDRRIWFVLAGCVAVCGSSLSVYSFVAPLLLAGGLPQWAIPVALVMFGVGAFVGSTVGGRLGDHRPFMVLIIGAGGTLATILFLFLLAQHGAAIVTLLGSLGLFGMATNPVLIGMAVRFAGSSPTLASALCTSSFNAGTAIGTAIAAATLTTGLSVRGPIAVGIIVAALYFIPIVLLKSSARDALPASSTHERPLTHVLAYRAIRAAVARPHVSSRVRDDHP